MTETRITSVLESLRSLSVVKLTRPSVIVAFPRSLQVLTVSRLRYTNLQYYISSAKKNQEIYCYYALGDILEQMIKLLLRISAMR